MCLIYYLNTAALTYYLMCIGKGRVELEFYLFVRSFLYILGSFILNVINRDKGSFTNNVGTKSFTFFSRMQLCKKIFPIIIITITVTYFTNAASSRNYNSKDFTLDNNLKIAFVHVFLLLLLLRIE